jgi:hypothetical protein
MSWPSAIILIAAKELVLVRLALFPYLEPRTSRNWQAFFTSFSKK